MIGNEFKIVDGYVVTNKFLGSGAFGNVFRGYKESDPKEIVAVKVLPIVASLNHNRNFMKLIRREIEILGKIQSQYIVKLYHAARTSRNYYIFLEYCNGGNLRDLMKIKGGFLSEQDAVTYFKQIVYGFKAIYQENVIHRDIKPANILLHNGIAKISDFGFARVVDDMEVEDKFTLLGTPLYMPPQILDQKKFNSKCDIWSLGIMFYEMLYGCTPWSAKSQFGLLEQIKTKPLAFPQQPKRQQLIKDLIAQMLIVDEDKRINWYDLFEHPLIKSNSEQFKNGLNEILKSVQDTLDQSAQVNQFYIKNNLVLEQGKQQEMFEIKENDEFNSTQEGDLQTFEDLKGFTYNDIVDKQTQKLQEQMLINKIDSLLTFQRNIGIFVNLTTNYVFELSKDQILQVPPHLFYRIIFILEKKQMIIFEDLTNIMASKLPIKNGFTDADWKAYKKNQQYFTTLKAIKTDKYFIKPYYEEVTKRTTNYLNSQIAQHRLAESEEHDVNEFFSIMANGLIQDMAFNAVYEKTIKQCLQIMYEQLSQKKKLNENRTFLVAIKYLILCLNPHKYFSEQKYNDFNKFYENYNNLEMEQLLEEIQKEQVDL